MRLVDQLGFDAVDAGGLDESWRQQPGTPVYGADFDAEGVRRGLARASKERPPKWQAPGTARARMRSRLENLLQPSLSPLRSGLADVDTPGFQPFLRSYPIGPFLWAKLFLIGMTGIMPAKKRRTLSAGTPAPAARPRRPYVRFSWCRLPGDRFPAELTRRNSCASRAAVRRDGRSFLTLRRWNREARFPLHLVPLMAELGFSAPTWRATAAPACQTCSTD